jgi:hypothetical protein
LVIVYIGSFFVHFMLVPFVPEDGNDVSRKLGLDTSFLVLKNESHLIDRRFSKLSHIVFRFLWDSHIKNMNVTARFPFRSPPYEWPLLTGKSVLFWKGIGEIQCRCFGNVFVYYPAFLAVVLAVTVLWRQWRRTLKYVLGWSVCYLPFFLIPRYLLLYHY